MAPLAPSAPTGSPLCVSISGSTWADLEASSRRLLPDFPFQELRLDYLVDLRDVTVSLMGLFAAIPEATYLVTCRPRRSGGHLQGSSHEELEALKAAARAGCSLVDLSLETAEEVGSSALASLRALGTRVLLSFHDFQKTGDLAATLARLETFAPDLCKLVPTANSLENSLDLLRLSQAPRGSHSALVAIAMGEAGRITRILGPRFGSAFTFAAASDTEATAPGQLTAQTLADLYRIGQITPATRLFAVAGDPIGSSLSPLMHNTAFHHAGLDAVYLPLKTSNPAELLHVAQTLPLEGFSVTMPLKRTLLPLLDSITPLAAAVGAVNTVYRASDGSLHGDNTDVAGIVVPLEQRLSLQGARILVLGAGGAARAAVFGCRERGAEVFLYNRTLEKAVALARESGATLLERSALCTEHFDVLIHATPAGMRGNAHSLPLEPHELQASLVFDLVYNPLETPLLTLARARGIAVIQGLEMFVHQGARQFDLWHRRPAPVEVMRSVVASALAAR